MASHLCRKSDRISKKVLEFINVFNKVTDIKSVYKNQLYFSLPAMKN